MSALQVLGAAMMATPFVVIGVHAVRSLGWKDALFCFGVAALITAFIGVGSYLLAGSQ